MAGVPAALTMIVPEVEASSTPVTATRGNVRVELPAAAPGLDTLIGRLPAFAVVRSEAGTLIVIEVPAALAVPVSGGLLPRVTVVELLNPVPVMMSCCAEVAPAINPTFGENEVSVGAALLTVAISVGEV